MGLFHRPTPTSPSSGHSFVNIIQNEGNNTGRGLIAWRHPNSDFNIHSKILVRKGEEAIFENGASEWTVFPSGTECELQTQNMAVIRSFREALSGGQSYFPCRVYFVSIEEFEIPWGTIDPIGYTCPVLGVGAQLRGGGIYVIRIIDTETFIKKMLRDNTSYTVDQLKEKLFERIYQEIADIISSVLEKNKINSMECSKKKKDIARLCLPEIQRLLDTYGIMLVDFTVSLELDDEQRQMYEQAFRLQRINAQGEAQARIIGAQSKLEEMQTMGNAYATIKGLDILQTIAENPGAGGLAGAGAGIGMGIATGTTLANITQSVFSDQQMSQPAPVQPDPVESLQKMKQLLDAGLIPQAAYDQKVAEILSRL